MNDSSRYCSRIALGVTLIIPPRIIPGIPTRILARNTFRNFQKFRDSYKKIASINPLFSKISTRNSFNDPYRNSFKSTCRHSPLNFQNMFRNAAMDFSRKHSNDFPSMGKTAEFETGKMSHDFAMHRKKSCTIS